MSDAFFTLHRDLPREGPGTAEDVRWALGQIPTPARVIDVACGPGADTETLAAALPDARIEAVDRMPHFVAATRARTARFGDRVQVSVGDMAEIRGPADLIWCAGAVYMIGIGAALAAWRPALAPGEHVAFSEPVHLTSPPSETVSGFWQGECDVGTAAEVAATVAAAGWRTVATRLIVGAGWADYYDPMERRIAQLRAGDVSPDLEAVLKEGEREIRLWRSAPDEIAYLLSVVAPA